MAKFNVQQRRELMGQFKDFYAELVGKDLGFLSSIYHEHVEFCDPVLNIRGCDALQSYLAHGLNNALSCKFVIHDEILDSKQGFLTWQMHLRHENLAKREEIIVSGSTHVRFDVETNRIIEHVDYYDLGAMIYEHIPLVGWLVKHVRKKMENA